MIFQRWRSEGGRCARGSALRVTVALAAGLLCACVRFPPPPPGVTVTPVGLRSPPLYPNGKPFRSSDESEVMVWMVADDLHTAMVFPYDWLVDSGFIPPAGFGNPPFVTMSWGDRVAYVQRKWLNPWQVCRAFFTPSPSVMEIIPFHGYVAETCHQQRIWRKMVKRERGPQVAAFLNHVSRTGADGRPLVIASSSWGGGVLVESQFTYYLPRICNVWTAQVMEACGCRMFPLTALTADGLIRQAKAPGNDFECVWPGNDKDAQE